MTTQPEALRLANSLAAHSLSRHGQTQAAAELRRLHQQELANIEWQEKTAWVQKTAKPDELGMHRADVMSRRLGRLKNQRDALMEALKDAAEAFELASNGGGVDFYAYAQQFREDIAKAEENT